MDSHGERFTKQDLEKFKAQFSDKFQINTMHSLAQPIAGTASNIRIVADPNEHDWNLIADVEVTDERFGIDFKGMSISILTPIFDLQSAEYTLALTYPTYNDTDYVSDLARTKTVSISKWRKKSDGSDQTAILIAMFAFLFTPVWEDTYHALVKPNLLKVLKIILPRLEHRNITLEFLYRIDFEDRVVDVRLLGMQSLLNFTVDDLLLLTVLKESRYLLAGQPEDGPRITQIVFQFDRIGRRFVTSRIDYADATSSAF